MALIDNQNKVIYWDEVNWQWLPYVSIEGSGVCYLRKNNKRFPIKCGVDAINILKSFGFCFSPMQNLGVIEISRGCFLYKDKLYPIGISNTTIEDRKSVV